MKDFILRLFMLTAIITLQALERKIFNTNHSVILMTVFGVYYLYNNIKKLS